MSDYISMRFVLFIVLPEGASPFLSDRLLGGHQRSERVRTVETLCLRTSSTSVQCAPSPSMPSGQSPHFTPWGVSLHFTPGWQGLGTQEGRGWIPPIAEKREASCQMCGCGCGSFKAQYGNMKHPSTCINVVLGFYYSCTSLENDQRRVPEQFRKCSNCVERYKM